MLRIFPLLAFTLVIGCSGGFGTMDRIMNSWMGASINEVINQWGYPHFQQDIAGRKLYHWDRNVSMRMPSTTTGTVSLLGNTAYLNTRTSGGGVLRGSCRRTLEVNKSNIVIGTQWRGNNCPFADVAMGYQHWQKK
ncbi:MAG: hypothetical protein ACJZ8K_04270 [Paracoccaceae bacterium]